MKKPLPLFVSLTIYTLISSSLLGQKGKNKDSNIPAFGNVEKTEPEVKECDVDRNAEAIVIDK
jgi:hypothetical protein